METHVVETCGTCQIKVRVLREKVGLARCPKCKGPLGDEKVDQRCAGCGAVNRVLRSKLATAHCGRCHAALTIAETPQIQAQRLVAQILAHPRLGQGRTAPRDLVETVDLLKGMPQAIAEYAANQPPGAERDTLVSMSSQSKTLAEQLRPLAFESAAVLLNDGFVQQYMLQDAFEAMRKHAVGFEALKAIRKQDKGLGAARHELLPSATIFERMVSRVHKPSWQGDGEQGARAALADQLFGEITRAIESWLIKPYKLDAMAKVALARLGELPGGAEALASYEALLREEMEVFLAIATTVIARSVAFHGLAPTPKQAWPLLAPSLRGAAVSSAS
ncbi:MAG TPA: hypothetical protein V6D47_18345 [Oscillatoriaceae cyanobacterium]